MERKKNRLKDLRIDRDITQKELAKYFDLQPTQYRRYENGESDLPLEFAKKLAFFYNVSIDYIAMIIDTPRTIDGKPYSVKNMTQINGNHNKIKIENKWGKNEKNK